MAFNASDHARGPTACKLSCISMELPQASEPARGQPVCKLPCKVGDTDTSDIQNLEYLDCFGQQSGEVTAHNPSRGAPNYGKCRITGAIPQGGMQVKRGSPAGYPRGVCFCSNLHGPLASGPKKAAISSTGRSRFQGHLPGAPAYHGIGPCVSVLIGG